MEAPLAEPTAAAALSLLRESSLLNEALCRLKAEEWAGAAAACTAVIERSGANTKARYRRGQALRGLGRAAEAKSDLVIAAALAPNDKEIRRVLAEAVNELIAAEVC